jgi:hypothetical protein
VRRRKNEKKKSARHVIGSTKFAIKETQLVFRFSQSELERKKNFEICQLTHFDMQRPSRRKVDFHSNIAHGWAEYGR